MRRRSLFLLHKVAGLAGGLLLGLLAVTGFFLDHENLDFLWQVTVDDRLLPDSMTSGKYRAVEAFRRDPSDPRRILVGTRRGLYLSTDGGRRFRKVLRQQVLALSTDGAGWRRLYAATTHGIYVSENGGMEWRLLALGGATVTAINTWQDVLYAVVDKRHLYRIGADGSAMPLQWTAPSPDVLPGQISLARLVRDLHYGRGLFDGDLSLLLNDGLAFLLLFLAVSGYVIYFKVRGRRLRHRKKRDNLRSWMRLHAHGLQVVATLAILLMLGLTGIFLDHAGFFRDFLRSARLDTAWLPPVYRSLATDVWGFDFDGENFRIGNRLGVFSSRDLVHWRLESEGFAWRMKRLGARLAVSGMGSPNRVLEEGRWRKLEGTPHMPRDFYLEEGELRPISPGEKRVPLPRWPSTSLYHILLGLHDGKLAWGQWVWLNDLSVLALLLLLYSGCLKWLYHRRRRGQHGLSRFPHLRQK